MVCLNDVLFPHTLFYVTQSEVLNMFKFEDVPRSKHLFFALVVVCTCGKRLRIILLRTTTSRWQSRADSHI